MTTNTNAAVDSIISTLMTQVQVCSSAYALIGSRFDRGHERENFETEMADLRNMLDSALSTAAQPPAGWRMVPVEPTIGMCIAGDEARITVNDSTRTPAVYRAMIAAAPKADHIEDDLAMAPAPLQQGEYPATGNPEADRVLGRLNSSDPEFDDCAEAAALIYKLVAEIKGPEGFSTWKDAAVYERGLRATLETTINTASPLAYLYTDGKHPGLDFEHAPAEYLRPGFVCIPLAAAHRAARGQALRLLTQKEKDSLGRRAEGMDGNEWDQWVQEKFAQVNGLRVQGGSYEWDWE